MRYVGLLALLLGFSSLCFAPVEQLTCRFVISMASGPVGEGHILNWSLQEPGRPRLDGSSELPDTDFVDEEVIIRRADGEPVFYLRWTAVEVDDDPGYRALKVQSLLNPRINELRTVFARDVEDDDVQLALVTPSGLSEAESKTFRALAEKLSGAEATHLHVDAAPESSQDFFTRERAFLPDWSKSPLRKNAALQKILWDGHNPEQFFGGDCGIDALAEYAAFYSAIAGRYGDAKSKRDFSVNVWTVPFVESSGIWQQVVAVEFYNNKTGVTSTFSFVRLIR